MENILTQQNQDQMNAKGESACIPSLIHRCQDHGLDFAYLSKSGARAWILGITAKNRKPVCYNVCVGGNHAAALFDIARNT